MSGAHRWRDQHDTTAWRARQRLASLAVLAALTCSLVLATGGCGPTVAQRRNAPPPYLYTATTSPVPPPTAGPPITPTTTPTAAPRARRTGPYLVPHPTSSTTATPTRRR